MRDSLMRDPSLLAFSRLRRAERALDMCSKARDSEKATEAHDAVFAASDEYDDAHPTTRKGVAIKLKQCVGLLKEEGMDDAADRLRDFFRSRATVDGAWLHDLRTLIEGVKFIAPENDASIACLQSILAGMSKLRLV